ncbi:ribonuclease P protein component [Psychrobacter sp. I-STPA10]|uniref:ribonuclease P protein component n=1 Tax=Psychrobacter sp. I-STPA10 TaxID=2585769 RepID=UPI001E34DF1E|nr:ribonuclease P protein component [Psychrobacter sp. I-STPA10]
MTNYTYPKTHRLLTSAHYKHVFDNVCYKVHQPHIMAFVSNTDSEYPRLGLAITKKKLKTAVSRNLVKRLIKERFRHYAPQLLAADMVFILKKPTTELSNQQITAQVDAIFAKILQKQAQKQTVVS